MNLGPGWETAERALGLKTSPDTLARTNAARNAVKRALKAGVLRKPKRCLRCKQRRKIEGHHDDYSLLLDVTWLCISCHARWHTFNRPKGI